MRSCARACVCVCVCSCRPHKHNDLRFTRFALNFIIQYECALKRNGNVRLVIGKQIHQVTCTLARDCIVRVCPTCTQTRPSSAMTVIGVSYHKVATDQLQNNTCTECRRRDGNVTVTQSHRDKVVDKCTPGQSHSLYSCTCACYRCQSQDISILIYHPTNTITTLGG